MALVDEAPSFRGQTTKDLLKDPAVSYLKELTFPENPEVDLIAVHGLRIPLNSKPWKEAHAFGVNTWVGGDPPDEVLWLKDLLPKKLKNIRVLLFGYNSSVGWDTSTGGVTGAAEDLLAKLKNKRQNASDRPILFVCHSLGGIVVKHAISKARSSLQYQSLYQHVRAIAFFATPHRGGWGAKVGQALSGALRRLTGNVRSSIMEALRKDSLISPDIHQYFLHCLTDANIHVCSFYEAKPLPGLNHLIVDRNSAMLGLLEPQEVTYQVPESDHSSICKFKSETQDYEIIMGFLSDLVNWAINSPPLPPDRQLTPQLSSSRSINDEQSGSHASSSSTDHELSSPRPGQDTSHLSTQNLRQSSPRPNSVGFSRQISPYNMLDSGASPDLTSSKDILPGFWQHGPYFLLPSISTSKFVGRQSIISRIQEILSESDEEQTRVALYGLGGVGKTQIALKIASWYRQSFPTRSVFWLRAKTASVFRQSLADIAVVCGLVTQGDGEALSLDHVRQLLLDKENGEWWIVIDNADNADIFGIPTISPESGKSPSQNTAAMPLLSYIPRCAHGQILFTTNSKVVGHQLIIHGHVIEVKPMDEHDSAALLERYLDETPQLNANPPSYQREMLTKHDIQTLCVRLDHLPLALAQAAAFMQQQSLTVTEYIELLSRDEKGLEYLLTHEFQQYGIEDDFSKAVASTWKVAFDKIVSKWPAAANLFCLMAFLDSQNIPKFLLRKFEPDEHQLTAIALGTLQAFALVNPNRGNETFNIHRLVQFAMRVHLASSASDWSSKALELIAEVFPYRDYKSWEIYADLVPHALEVLKNNWSQPSTESRLLIATLASKVSWYYVVQGQYTQSEDLSRKAWECLQSTANPPFDLALKIKAVWVLALKETGRSDQAEKFAKEVWLGRQKAKGGTEVDALESRIALSLIYQDQGYYEKAAKAAREATKGLGKRPERNDMILLQANTRLGMVLTLLGENAEAERLLRTAYDGFTRILGFEHPLTLKANWRLATILYAEGLYKQSERISEETWMIQKRTLTQNHPDTLKTFSLLAQTRQAQLRFDVALAMMREIHSKATSLVGSYHRYTIIAADNLASCLLSFAAGTNGKEAAVALKEAEELYKLVYDQGSVKLRPDHPEVLAAKTGVATVQRLQRRLQEAETLQREALSKLKKSLGKKNPRTLAAQENLARVLWERKESKNKVKEAVKLATAVLKVRDDRLGWRSPETTGIATFLADMLPEGKRKSELQAKISQQEKATEGESDSKDLAKSMDLKEYGSNRVEI